LLLLIGSAIIQLKERKKTGHAKMIKNIWSLLRKPHNLLHANFWQTLYQLAYGAYYNNGLTLDGIYSDC